MAGKLTSFITPDSLSELPESSVAVCAHDAGAASHMAAWLAPHRSQLRACLEGPARSLLTERLGALPEHSLESSIKDACMLISGSGWSSDLEHNARALARMRGIPCVAVLDHWVNYRERFVRNEVEVLPDQLWVADEEAHALAQAAFPDLPVLQLPNNWLREISKIVTSTRMRPAQHPARKLIYLLEPIREEWQNAQKPGEPGEVQGIRYLLEKLPELIRLGWVAPLKDLEALTLRLHPSEPSGKYDALLEEAERHCPIRLDTSKTLAKALAANDAAFGCETQALVAAIACGLPAFSTVPPWAPPCRLPHLQIKHLSSLE
jgi:hypothetical protein